MCMYICIYLSIYPFIHPSIRLFIHPSIYLSIFISCCPPDTDVTSLLKENNFSDNEPSVMS